MLNENNNELRLGISILFLLLLNSIFSHFLVLGNPINVYNNSLLNKNFVSQDSIIYFKIIDSITKESIPFATIVFIENDTTKMSIVSNEDGSFSIPNSSSPKKVKISAVGYEEQLFYLFHVNRLLLKPLKSLLPEIIIRSKAKKTKSANAIIKHVANRFVDNYGNFSFSQILKFSSEIYNYDTLKEKAEEFVKVYYRNADKSMKSPNWIKDTLYQDKLFTNFIGVPQLCTGDIIPWFDMLRKGLPIDGNNNKGLDFKLISKYKDEKYGLVYIVSFMPNQSFKDSFLGRTVGGLARGYLKGEIRIREFDYSIIRLKYIWEMKVESLNGFITNLFHTKTWHANRVTKMISDKIIYKYDYIYNKDVLTGKYFIDSINAECFNSGYQIETNRNLLLNLKFNVSSIGIEKEK
ncbi:hypothetical protein [Sediminibacterium sp.]|nr:hypothetical protein [Sediminibacterium sp.]MDP3568143.1 hypothetical protein [Sediminibacterium sp.]